MATKISSYTALGAQPDAADLFVLVDDDAGATKKITYANLMLGASGLELVGQTTVAGAATTTVTVSSLDGDADGIWLVHCLVKQATASVGNWELRPNGATTLSRNQNMRVEGGTAAASTSTKVLAMSGTSGTTADWHEAWVLIYAASGAPRFFHAFNYKQDSGDGSGGTLAYIGSTWDDDSTNITSLELVSSVASQTDIGSVVSVYKVKAA